MILPILTYGSPILKKEAKEITQDAPSQDKPAGLLAKPEGETTDGN